MIDGLTNKVKAWEKERGVPFLCDKVTNCTFAQLSFLWFDSAYISYSFFSIQHPLLQTLEEEIVLRAQREEEKRQFRVCVLVKTRICRQTSVLLN